MKHKENKQAVGLVTIDQSALFDVIYHKILIRKMRHVGIDSDTINIIENMLHFQT